MVDRVLIIDDRQRMEPIVAAAARGLGLETESAVDFRGAKSAILECKPAAIVCSLALGDDPAAGFGFCAELRTHPDFSDIPVILAADLVTEDEIRKAEESGAKGLIQWPAPVQLIQRRIEVVLGRSGGVTASGAAESANRGEAAKQPGNDPALTEQFRLAQNILAKALYQLKTSGRLAGAPLEQVPGIVYDVISELCRPDGSRHT